jgi:hypothetical protein
MPLLSRLTSRAPMETTVHFFFFVGASALLAATGFWRDVHQGVEDIPMGSMIHGDDDANGDMTRLMDEFGWTAALIPQRYLMLAAGCWTALLIVYAWFAARLDRVLAHEHASGRLFATALGLFAAIPALIFYNKFSGDITAFSERLSNFAQEVSVRLSRRLLERRDA